MRVWCGECVHERNREKVRVCVCECVHRDQSDEFERLCTHCGRMVPRVCAIGGGRGHTAHQLLVEGDTAPVQLSASLDTHRHT